METIGDRIRAARGDLMTQRELAEAAGVSVKLVQALEQNDRMTSSIGSLVKIADALDRDPGDLLGRRRSLPSTAHTGVQEVLRALTPVDDLLGEVVDEGQDEDLADVDAVRRAVDYAWGLYWSGRYEPLIGILPAALAQLAAAGHAAPSTGAAAMHELRARGLWVTACVLVHLGHPAGAYLAVRQALDAAGHGTDDLLDAVLRGSLSWQMLAQGRYTEATGLALRTAKALEPEGGTGAASPQRRSVYGSLLISAATATARGGRAAAAAELLDEAGRVAALDGDRTDYESPFGPSQVVMQTVDVAVVTEDYDQAVIAARAMPRAAALPLAARARHLTDVALARTQLGDLTHARDTLLTVHAMAPDWMAHQHLPRQVLAELRLRDRNPRLRDLARALGVTEN